MTFTSIRRAVAQWIYPLDTVAEVAALNATIKTQQETIVGTRQQLADSSAALATSAAQLSTLTGALAARDQTIATDAATIAADVAELTAWGTAADATIAEQADAKAKVDAAVAAGTPKA